MKLIPYSYDLWENELGIQRLIGWENTAFVSKERKNTTENRTKERERESPYSAQRTQLQSGSTQPQSRSTQPQSGSIQLLLQRFEKAWKKEPQEICTVFCCYCCSEKFYFWGKQNLKTNAFLTKIKIIKCPEIVYK